MLDAIGTYRLVVTGLGGKDRSPNCLFAGYGAAREYALLCLQEAETHRVRVEREDGTHVRTFNAIVAAG